MTTTAAPRRGEGEAALLFPTSLVGSYPQPGWLIDRARLAVPRVPTPDLWLVAPELLAEAQDDAARLAVADQLAAGLDIITDGESRRESYSNRFAAALDGLDLEHPGSVPARTPGREMIVPRVVGPIRRRGSVERAEVEFLRTLTDKTIKVTVPGPFTMSQQVVDDYYHDDGALSLAYAAAVNAEIADLFAAGADIVQIDEPFFAARRTDLAREFGLAALEAALQGLSGTTAVHLCFGYASLVADRPAAYPFLTELAGSAVDQISIETAQSNLDVAVLEELGDKTVILGVIDLSTDEVETAEVIEARVERALRHTSPERLVLAPDCGMKFLPRGSAAGKLAAMASAAVTLRARYAG
jgi:5-methyltetrahydropteroyltriglutamate--homocysteine methyltransferase